MPTNLLLAAATAIAHNPHVPLEQMTPVPPPPLGRVFLPRYPLPSDNRHTSVPFLPVNHFLQGTEMSGEAGS